MRKRSVLFVLAVCFLLSCWGCGSPDIYELDCTLDGLYLADDYAGYRFFDDGTVIYYEANPIIENGEIRGCEPEYRYGAYRFDGEKLTITLPGTAFPITGTVSQLGVAVIDGKECPAKTTPYYSEEMDSSWQFLDRTLGLSE